LTHVRGEIQRWNFRTQVCASPGASGNAATSRSRPSAVRHCRLVYRRQLQSRTSQDVNFGLNCRKGRLRANSYIACGWCPRQAGRYSGANRTRLYSSAVSTLDAGQVDNKATGRRQALHVDAGNPLRTVRPGGLVRRGKSHPDKGGDLHAIRQCRGAHAGRSGQNRKISSKYMPAGCAQA